MTVYDLNKDQIEWGKFLVRRDDFNPKILLSHKNPRWKQIGSWEYTRDVMWDAGGSNGFVVRAFVNGNDLQYQVITDPGTSDGTIVSWSSAATLHTESGGWSNLPPPIVAFDWQYWYIFCIDSSNTIKCWRAPIGDPTTWTSNDVYGSVTVPSGANVAFFGYGGANEVHYVVLNQADHNQHIVYLFEGDQYETDFYYPQKFYSFDVQWFTDYTAYPQYAGTANGNIRHLIVVATQRPPVYQYTQGSDGTPIQTGVATGGVISWVVTPPPRGAYGDTIATPGIDVGTLEPPPMSIPVKIQFPNHEEVDVVSPFTTFQSRMYGKISTLNTFMNSNSLPVDKLVITSYGSEGDWNAYHPTVYYEIMTMYTSHDGVHWSQGERIVSPDLGFFAIQPDYQGFAIVQAGYHLYLVNKTFAAIARTVFPYTPTFPDNLIDVTDFVSSYQSQFNQMRQSSLTLENVDDYVIKSIQTEGEWNSSAERYNMNALDVLYYFGDGANIEQLVSWETVDTLSIQQQASQSGRSNQMQIVSRGKLAEVTDKKSNIDAILHDSPNIRTDTYSVMNGVANSGLGHTSVQSGTMGTDTAGALQVLSNNKLTVGFSTFKDGVENGEIIIYVKAPVVSILDGYTAGLVFRGIDKDNFFYWHYDFYNQRLSLKQSVASTMSSELAGQALSISNIVEVGDSSHYYFRLGVRMYYNRFWLRCWYGSHSINLSVPDVELIYSPPGQPALASNNVFMSGYVGPAGQYFSDQDNGAANDSTGVSNPPTTVTPPSSSSNTGSLSSDGSGNWTLTYSMPQMTILSGTLAGSNINGVAGSTNTTSAYTPSIAMPAGCFLGSVSFNATFSANHSDGIFGSYNDSAGNHAIYAMGVLAGEHNYEFHPNIYGPNTITAQIGQRTFDSDPISLNGTVTISGTGTPPTSY